jgi:SAM-dependent methyltransferase
MAIPYNFNPDIRHPLYLIRRSIFRHISAQAPQLSGKMLDFGCGSKPYRSLFAVQEYIGLDYENPGHPHLNEQIDVFYDGKTIPFPDNSFDSVLATEVFEHVFRLDDTLQEINRVMKPGGRFLISVPFVFVEHEIPHDFARYSSFGLRDLLLRNGFSVLSLEKTSNFVETLAQMRIWYLNTTFLGYLRRIPLLGKILSTFLLCLLNLTAIAFGKILPAKQEWYLGLVVLAQKNQP